MSAYQTSVEPPSISNRKRDIALATLFLIVAVAGLTYVKWWPYVFKAMSAAANQSIGSSIVTGGEATAPEPSWNTAWDYAMSYYKSVWKAVVLGILLGSLVQVLIPTRWLLEKLGQHSLKSTVLGAFASLPGMMCTCCAAPIAVGLRKKNVSVGAALAFWIGNPALNPAVLIFMTFVLSWKFTLLRLVFGVILTIGVSYLANRFAPSATVNSDTLPKLKASSDQPLAIRWLKQVWSMILYIVPTYIIAVLVLGAFRAWLFPDFGSSAVTGIGVFLLIILFAIVGTLFVIPTAAEIPIIQTMMSFGLGAGPASALLVTLPSVSLPSFMMLARSFPRKVLLFVALSVIAVGIACGLIGAIIL